MRTALIQPIETRTVYVGENGETFLTETEARQSFAEAELLRLLHEHLCTRGCAEALLEQLLSSTSDGQDLREAIYQLCQFAPLTPAQES